MKKNLPNILILLFFLCVCFQSNAQTNKSYISAASEGMPMNRAAFIFCYNNNTVVKNPATAVLKNKVTHKTMPVVKEQTVSIENISMYPNSTEDELWVQIKSESVHENDLLVEIFDAYGVRIYNSAIQQNLHKINVCDFSAGTFLVKLGDNVRKLVIE